MFLFHVFYVYFDNDKKLDRFNNRNKIQKVGAIDSTTFMCLLFTYECLQVKSRVNVTVKTESVLLL